MKKLHFTKQQFFLFCLRLSTISGVKINSVVDNTVNTHLHIISKILCNKYITVVT